MKISVLLACFLLLGCIQAISQGPGKVKFGKISPSDFEPTVYPIDSNANAVVLLDIGSSAFEGNDKGRFSLIFKRLTRIRIMNKNGYDAGEVRIPLYADDDDEEKIESLHASTYNLENGKVVETKFDSKTDLFKDKISKKVVVKKFTLPNLREGSIIEVEYKIVSDFIFNLQPWTFQGPYPTLWSEYKVSMPQFYNYVTLTQGYQPYFIKESKDKVESFSLEEPSSNLTSTNRRSSFSAGVTDFRFAMKDVPALKEESYTSTLRNHVSKIEFQLSEVSAPFVPQKIMDTWPVAAGRLLERENFGLLLKRDDSWMQDYLDEATRGANNDKEKTRAIYTYLRDQLTERESYSIFSERNLRTVMKARSGTEAEINLLLVAMLRRAGIPADPVLLSTKDNGFPYADYPLIERFNYVICRANVNGEYILLDASRARLGFGKLGSDLYNGHARVINEAATPLELSSDSNQETKVTAVFLVNGKPGHFNGKFNQTMGYYESSAFRDRMLTRGADDVLSSMKRNFGSEVTYSNYLVDSLKKYDLPVAIHYDFDMPTEDADLLYINPMFTEGQMENPFKSAERYYPVEMPYKTEETYILRMDIPTGYEVDELPKQIKVKLNEQGDGFFEYLISVNDGVVSLRSKLQLKRSYYHPDEYEMLRQFFSIVVKKHNEQIVFKKKK